MVDHCQLFFFLGLLLFAVGPTWTVGCDGLVNPGMIS